MDGDKNIERCFQVRVICIWFQLSQTYRLSRFCGQREKRWKRTAIGKRLLPSHRSNVLISNLVHVCFSRDLGVPTFISPMRKKFRSARQKTKARIWATILANQARITRGVMARTFLETELWHPFLPKEKDSSSVDQDFGHKSQILLSLSRKLDAISNEAAIKLVRSNKKCGRSFQRGFACQNAVQTLPCRISRKTRIWAHLFAHPL